VTNGIQWLMLIIGVLCVVVPPTLLVFERPWTRRPRLALSGFWYSAVAVMVLGGSVSVAFVFFSSGDLRRSRAAWLNDSLEAIASAAGAGAGALPALVVAIVLVGSALVASLRRRPVHLPATIDAVMLRRLIGAGEDVELLESAYPPSDALPEADRALAIALGRADAEAKHLARWVPKDSYLAKGDRAASWAVHPLLERVLRSQSLQDSHAALEDLRSLARWLDASR
jgi:hypothetical protein